MRTTLLCLGLLAGAISRGQSPKKNAVALYAYCRVSTPGAHIFIEKESGDSDTIIPVQNSPGWFFYVEVPAGVLCKPLYLLLNQQKIPVTVEPVKNTPVLFERPGLLNQVERDTLVPAAVGKVYRLLPITSPALTAEKATLQLVYSIHKKIKQTAVRPIEMLPPLVLE